MEDGKIIKELAIASQEVRFIEDKPFVVVPPDYQVRSLENFLSAPKRKSGIVNMHDSISFIEYFNLHKNDSSAIYAMVDPTLFHGVLNDHANNAAGWRDHVVDYACPHSKEWQIWSKSDKSQLGQVQFAQFIEANLPDIYSKNAGDPTGADMLQIAVSFQAKTSVEFASGTRLQNGQTELNYTEKVNGSAGPKGSIKIPEAFFIAIPVYEGGSTYRVEAKFRYRISGGNLTMWYELVRPHKTIESAFMDVWKKIEEGTGKKILRGSSK
jgi:uncharacterized protein YfdQ (DUF2303 family)